MKEFGQYDHLRDKKFCLSRWDSRCSFTKEDFLKEQAKCRALCPNHHNLHSHYQDEKKRQNNTLLQTKRAIYQRNRIKRNKEHVNQIKRNLGKCEICQLKVKEGEERMFQFDHKGIVPKKNRGICELVKGRVSIARIDHEISLCRLICHNCAKVWDKKQHETRKVQGLVINRKPINKIKFKFIRAKSGCVSFHKFSKKWRVVCPGGKHLGLFVNKQEAITTLADYKALNPDEFSPSRHLIVND